ncbi:hypothetical protein ONZ45_g12143 [Pleurotus djamor]|nr:hypothetical protein ONZ45_g12143 [Pleurotus djamor]
MPPTSTKVVAFGLDDTIWSGRLDESLIRANPKAAPRVEDNLEQEGELVVRDKNNHKNRVTLFRDIPNIVNDVLRRGMMIAIVSKNPSAAICNRALWYFKAKDVNGRLKPIIDLVTYNEVGPKVDKELAFRQIQTWSGATFAEMLFFDVDSSALNIHRDLGVEVKLVNGEGLDWQTYQGAMKGKPSPTPPGPRPDPYDTPFYGLPALGALLGKGKFAKVYDSKDNPNAVVKVLEHWTADLRSRFLEIYRIIKDGKPFKPKDGSNDEQFLLMLAFEVRNLNLVKQLIAPEPVKFTGWFMMKRVEGTALWKTPLYREHPFSVTFQKLLKAASHLAVDEIEAMVKEYGVEHRDAHLGNVYYTMKDDMPIKGHLLDWGIAVLMKWDGKHYVRGNDVLVWGDNEAGAAYKPEEFRRYWIRWLVTTEYEAQMKRGAISEKDSRAFLKNLDWWFDGRK